MANRDLLNAFEDCIERLAAGQSLDDCLRRYPQHATALRPMLEAGSLVRRASFSASEVSAARDRVRFRVAQRVGMQRSQPVFRIVPLVASLVVIFFFMAGAMTMLAENSLPGDALYGFKLLTENVRLAVLNDNGVLDQQFGQRRTTEIQQLLLLNRAADVTFQGELQAINGTEWLVAGIQLEVSAGIPGADTVQPGDLIEIQGVTTAEGQLIARAIRLIGHNQSLPSTTLTPTFTPMFTPTLTLTATPTITIPTSTPAPTSTDSQTPIPSATSCVANQPEGWVIYTVQPGDSLSGLAARTGTTLEELMRVNCLADRSLIVTGQQLFLPMTPSSIATQTAPQVRPTTTSEDIGEQDNSGRGENSGSDSGDDEREDEDNSGSDDDGGENSGHGGGDD